MISKKVVASNLCFGIAVVGLLNKKPASLEDFPLVQIIQTSHEAYYNKESLICPKLSEELGITFHSHTIGYVIHSTLSKVNPSISELTELKTRLSADLSQLQIQEQAILHLIYSEQKPPKTHSHALGIKKSSKNYFEIYADWPDHLKPDKNEFDINGVTTFVTLYKAHKYIISKMTLSDPKETTHPSKKLKREPTRHL